MEITINFNKENGITVKTSEQVTIAEMVGMLEIAKTVILNNINSLSIILYPIGVPSITKSDVGEAISFTVIRRVPLSLTILN